MSSELFLVNFQKWNCWVTRSNGNQHVPAAERAGPHAAERRTPRHVPWSLPDVTAQGTDLPPGLLSVWILPVAGQPRNVVHFILGC